MGYMRHHAIIVTAYCEGQIREAHAKASEIFPVVSAVLNSQINGYQSFFIPPDGSKEGWTHSDEGDARRDEFIQWMEKRRLEVPWLGLDWVEVQYGDDDRETRICRDSDAVVRAEDEASE